MPDNDFWIGQEQIPVDLSLLLTYHNDEDYWYAPGEYALRVYTVDTLNTNFPPRPRKLAPISPSTSAIASTEISSPMKRCRRALRRYLKT